MLSNFICILNDDDGDIDGESGDGDVDGYDE